MAIFSLVSGAISKVARFKAAKQKAAIGQQINLILIFTIVWGVILALLLFALKVRCWESLIRSWGSSSAFNSRQTLYISFRIHFLIYLIHYHKFDPSPAVFTTNTSSVRLPTRFPAPSWIQKYWSVTITAAPILAANQLLGATILGMRKYLIQGLLVISASLFDIGSTFAIFYGFHADSNDPIAYATIASRSLLFILIIIFFYRPSMRRKFHMFPFKLDKGILKAFMIDSGFLFLRGTLIMATYFGSPVSASRLGTTQLDAHTIMANLYMYPVLIGDSIGTASNIVGSRFLGGRKFSSFSRLTKIATLAATFVSVAFACMYPYTNKILMRTRETSIFLPTLTLSYSTPHLLNFSDLYLQGIWFWSHSRQIQRLQRPPTNVGGFSSVFPPWLHS